MKRKIELLAPGGNVDSIKAAIIAGADAVYCGLNKFNARNRAANISFDELQGILRLAHKNNCEVFLTLNIIVLDSEIPALIKLLNRLVNTTIDGVIVQDYGMFYLLSKYFKGLKIHASTQVTTHNEGQIQFLSKLNAQRVNLSRELNINEIKALTGVAHINGVLTEVFVHGSYCISFSGICYMSSVNGGNSGNRGQCSQPCRDRYLRTPAGKDFPLNLKDNSAFFDLKELYEAGVDSLKIEGRIKEFEYVYTVVKMWKKQLHNFYKHNSLIKDNSDLYKVFNRDFSNSFLKGDINKDMFIDNPMSHSAKHFSEHNNYPLNDDAVEGLRVLHEEKELLKTDIENKIQKLSIAKIPLSLSISGECGVPLKVLVQTPNTMFEVLSDVCLADFGKEPLNAKQLLKRLKAINDTEYYIEQMKLHLNTDLFLPFNALTSLKKRIVFILNGSIEMQTPVDVPKLKRHKEANYTPTLSVLISSINDVKICNDAAVNVFFQLPSNFRNDVDVFKKVFSENKELLPWFPSVLIGEDYRVAVQFLKQIHPKRIVTNNTGIAFEAYKNGIEWIAGPDLNIANSYGLLCLKENFNCYGSFLSNEISKQQLMSIKKPVDFELYYKIYQPVLLITSRQCLFHQVTGCEKNKLDDTCMQYCGKTSTITNLKNEKFIINKTKGNYHSVYSATNLLNTDIVNDMPGVFSSFFIDLRNTNTQTKLEQDKAGIIKLFKSHIKGEADSIQQLQNNIHPSNNKQYRAGI